MMRLARFRSLAFTGHVKRLRFASVGALGLALVVAAPALAQLGTGSVDSGEDVFSRVLSYEWNTDGDFEGWTPNPNINNATVAGGAMSGESLGDGSFPAGADPFFGSPGGLGVVIGSGAGEVNRVQFAVQFNAGAPTVRTEMFIFPTAGAFGSHTWSPGDFPTMTDGGLHTYTLDFDSTSPLWGATIGTVRLDPVADNQNAVDTFAYDFLRLGSSIDPGQLGGDVNLDNKVDAADFEIIRANFFGKNVGRGNGDLTQDGVVDLRDFGEWKDNFPFPSEPFLLQLVGAVPEPGSAVLAVVGVVCGGLTGRRRRVSAA